MRQKDETPCFACGLPRYEHDLNGAAYGTCGRWVPPYAATLADSKNHAQVEAIRLAAENERLKAANAKLAAMLSERIYMVSADGTSRLLRCENCGS